MASRSQGQSARPHIHDDNDPSEQTPLLGGGHLAPDGVTEAASRENATEATGLLHGESNGTSKGGKPLPKLQLFLLCYARVMEPIAFFSIFPFIAQMVHRVGDVPKSDVGFYSGLVESLFSAVQMMVLIFWGRLADRVGRKPVMMCSLVGMAIAPMLFGMSTSIWQMILFRCIAGAFSGSSLIIRTMIAEISTPETQASAFSWFAFAGNVGIFIGPLIGGALADPVEQYPGIFMHIDFFIKYPYALAGFVTGAVSATSAITTALFLKETLPADKSGEDDDAKAKRSSMWELLNAPGVGIVLWVYGHVMFLAFTFTAIMPVYLYMPVNLGGLGLGPTYLSAYMASQGASQALWLLVAFPRLHRRFGTRGVMKGCGIVYPFFFAGYIVLNLLLRNGSDGAMVAFWILLFIVALIGPGISMVFTGSQLALNDVSPDPHVLGTLNAIALTGSSAIRSVIPGVATAIYSIGVRNETLMGHLAWVILIPIAAAMPFFANMLPEGRKPKPVLEDEEEES